MTWMNEYDIEDAERNTEGLDNAHRAAEVLSRLRTWTNRNSDGWPYWQKPAKAADKLMTLLQSIDRFDPEDVTEAEVKAALTPIKRFLTTRGLNAAESAEIIDGPPPPVDFGDREGPQDAVSLADGSPAVWLGPLLNNLDVSVMQNECGDLFLWRNNEFAFA